MKQPTWKVLDWGEVPEAARQVELTCECGHEALLPVVGTVIAAVDCGRTLIFEHGARSLPSIIQCRKCGRVMSTEVPSVR